VLKPYLGPPIRLFSAERGLCQVSTAAGVWSWPLIFT